MRQGCAPWCPGTCPPLAQWSGLTGPWGHRFAPLARRILWRVSWWTRPNERIVEALPLLQAQDVAAPGALVGITPGDVPADPDPIDLPATVRPGPPPSPAMVQVPCPPVPAASVRRPSPRRGGDPAPRCATGGAVGHPEGRPRSGEQVASWRDQSPDLDAACRQSSAHDPPGPAVTSEASSHVPRRRCRSM